MWVFWNDSQGTQHKCKRQQLLNSCVPACMAMIVRSVSTTNEGYDEDNARTHLKSVMPQGVQGSAAMTFINTGVALNYVSSALKKKNINDGVKRLITVNATNLKNYFSVQKPGIVGVTLTLPNNTTINHAVVCKGEISLNNFLFICPGYGPHEVPANNITSFGLTDLWQLGLPNVTASPTGDAVTFI